MAKMTKTKLPAQVSKWEIGGVPAAMILEVLYEMEMLPDAVKADLPRIILLCFIVVASIRAYMARNAEEDLVDDPEPPQVRKTIHEDKTPIDSVDKRNLQ